MIDEQARDSIKNIFELLRAMELKISINSDSIGIIDSTYDEIADDFYERLNKLEEKLNLSNSTSLKTGENDPPPGLYVNGKQIEKEHKNIAIGKIIDKRHCEQSRIKFDTKTEGFTFSEALECLKKGQIVKRSSWVNKSFYLRNNNNFIFCVEPLMGATSHYDIVDDELFANDWEIISLPNNQNN